MSFQNEKSPDASTGTKPSQSGPPPSKGFVVLLGIEGDDPDEVVRSLVQLRKEKGWSSRSFSLPPLRGSEGLYEEWCVKMSSEVRRLRFASSAPPVQHEQKALDAWNDIVPGQFDDADNN